MTDVVILCGGRGTRLRPETESRPKPLLPVGDRPILDHVIGHFRGYGFRRFVLCLGYCGGAIRAHFRARAGGPLAVPSPAAETVEVEDGGTFTAVLVDTGLDTATGGRVKQVAPHILSERFIVAYADVLSDVNLAQLCASHRRHGRMATVTAVRPMSPFGHLVLGDGDVVHDFREKPRLDNWVSIGFVVLERAVLSRLTVDAPSLEVGLFRDIAREGQLSAFRHDGYFEPMDSYADYTRLNEMDCTGQLDWIGGGKLHDLPQVK